MQIFRILHTMYRLLFVLILIVLLPASCMKDMPEELPKNLVWEPELAIPIGKDRFGLDAKSGFDTTLFELDTLTELPQWVGMVNVALEGRLDFDLSSLETSTENINRILFRVGIFNAFPDAVMAQAYFYDNSSMPLDSMFSEGPVPVAAGTPIGRGDSCNPSIVRHDAIVSKERIPGISSATTIVIRALILKPGLDTSLIPYYRNYYIESELGNMLDLRLEF